MGAKIIWSPEVADDLEQIADFIGRDSPRYARQVATEVLEAIERAAMFPNSGRVVPELDDPVIREVFVYSYRIIYRTSTEAIHIGAIVHGARDLKRALGGRTI